MGNIKIWSFNKGEWTEAFVFLKLLGVGRLYGATANFEKDESTFIDIKNIIRNEGNDFLKFELDKELQKVTGYLNDHEFIFLIPSELEDKAAFLYSAIKHAGSRRTLTIPEIQNYMEQMKLSGPKADLSNELKEKYGSKTDIVITKIDSFDSCISTEGFSIKSHLGSSPTLLNVSSTSQFRYKVIGCTEELMHMINSLDKYLDMVKAIVCNGLKLEFVGLANENYKENLQIVDSSMDKLLSEALLLFSGYYDGIPVLSADTKNIAAALCKLNPLHKAENRAEQFYTAKLKDLLFASFAGLTASNVWDGRKLMSGGYIDVSNEGNLLYYRAISDEIFTSYLFNITYFDRPDRGYPKDLAIAQAKAYFNNTVLTEEEIFNISHQNGKKKSKKGDFGYIYLDDGNYYFDINFQIRFR